MRSTIHLVSREDYWPFALAVREARRTSWLRSTKRDPPEAAAEQVRAALARRQHAAAQGDRGADRQGGGARRRAVGRPRAGAAVGHVGAAAGRPLRARRGLDRPARDRRAGRAGAPRAALPRRLRARHRQGRRLVHRPPAPRSPTASTSMREDDLLDVAGAPRPDPDTPAPPRFLGTWDASLLVHARRTGVLPEEHRPKIFHTKAPQSFPTFTRRRRRRRHLEARGRPDRAQPVRPARRRRPPRARGRGRGPRRAALASAVLVAGSA